ncbi:MAG TPA: SMC family ATPase [Gemmatimonadaceae bacterium]|nr:SMC family ATPase [Gemmatimonadaceae bacterium]
MRLNGLRLTNFRQHVDTRLEFDTGLTGIIGPNGAGKSTILEAISWALYGSLALRTDKEGVRTIRATGRAPVKVELDFELAGHRYRVDRGLTSAELYLDGGAEPVANSVTGVTDFLRRRLRMTRQEFFNTYFTGQKDLSVMNAMGPTERKHFLSRVLGYDRLRAAQEMARERRRLVTAQLNGLRSAMPDPESVERMLVQARERLAAATARAGAASARAAAARRVVDELDPRWTAMQQQRETSQRLSGERRVLDSESANLARELERLEREGGEIAAARGELEQLAEQLRPLAALAERLKAMDDLYRAEGRRQTLLENDRVLTEELVRLRERVERVQTAPTMEEEVTVALEAKRKELRDVEGALEAQRTEWVRDRQEAETKIQALRQQYAELKQQRETLVNLGEDGICPTCARPLGDHYRNVLDLLDAQMETVQVDGNYYRQRIGQLEEMPEEVKALDDQRRRVFDDVGKLERRLAKVQLAVQEMAQLRRDVAEKEQRHATLQQDLQAVPSGFDADEHRRLLEERARLQPLDAKATKLSALIEREEPVRLAVADVRARLDGVHARARALAEELDTLRFSEDAFVLLRGQHEGAMAEFRAAELAAVQADGEVAAATIDDERARTAQRDLDEQRRKADALTAERRLHDELDDAFEDLRFRLNEQLRPEISGLASTLITDLTDGRYTELELDDDYAIRVLEDGVRKPAISGGEEDVANLVLRLAISQMIADRAGQPFSLLVLDEVFGSLDEVRRQNVVELLRRLHDRFEQVIVITHIESVREGLDRVIAVSYDEEAGESRVRMERPGETAPSAALEVGAGAEG